ncbi:MAG: glycosyltransferase family 2 protein, partial [Alphaproteobacteria bacterium]
MPDSSLPLPAKSTSALERQLAAQRARRPADPLLSLVVPVFNEDESIGLFLTTVEPFLERAGLRFEIVFVNDGSRDDTLSHLLDCSRQDPRIRVVNLSRNFGKEAALTAGIDHARGDILIPMDIDLQDPPDLFGPFIERWREGYDIVYGVRQTRAWDTMSKRVSAGWFYWAFNRMSPVPIPA